MYIVRILHLSGTCLSCKTHSKAMPPRRVPFTYESFYPYAAKAPVPVPVPHPAPAKLRLPTPVKPKRAHKQAKAGPQQPQLACNLAQDLAETQHWVDGLFSQPTSPLSPPSPQPSSSSSSSSDTTFTPPRSFSLARRAFAPPPRSVFKCMQYAEGDTPMHAVLAAECAREQLPAFVEIKHEMLEAVDLKKIASLEGVPQWNAAAKLWTLDVRHDPDSAVFATYWAYKINADAAPFAMTESVEECGGQADVMCTIFVNPFVAVTSKFCRGGPCVPFRIKNHSSPLQPSILADLPLLPVERDDTHLVCEWAESRVFYMFRPENIYDEFPVAFKK
jgi:hypothetical protein